MGFRPRVRALPSVAAVPNERWATDLCRVWTGRDGWATLALVMDCHSRELFGWHLSRSGRSKTAESCQRQSKSDPPLIVSAKVNVDHPLNLFSGLRRGGRSP